MEEKGIMAWSISFNEQTRILEHILSEPFKVEELPAVVKSTLEAGRTHDTRLILSNCLAIEKPISLLKVFGLIRLVEPIPWDRTLKHAVLTSPLPVVAKEMEFYVTIARNRGFNVRSFRHRDEAVDWLLGSGTPPACSDS